MRFDPWDEKERPGWLKSPSLLLVDRNRQILYEKKTAFWELLLLLLSGGGTGKRDRQRGGVGKRKAGWLSRPYKTGIRARRVGGGDTTTGSLRVWGRVGGGPIGAGWLWGRWLCPGKGRRLRHSQPGCRPRCSSPGSARRPCRHREHPAPFRGSPLGPPQSSRTAGADGTPLLLRQAEEMEDENGTEPWHRSLQAMLDALNQTLHGTLLRPAAPRNASARGAGGRDDNAYMYILFVMTLFAATVGSLILGYTRSRKVDKRSDPYHVYIKNRVSMI